MAGGIGGSLLSASFLETTQPAEMLASPSPLVAAWRTGARHLGPASSLRAMLESGARPLFAGFGCEDTHDVAEMPRALSAIVAGGSRRITLIVTSWGDRLDTFSRASIAEALRRGTAWCALYNGLELRILPVAGMFGRRSTAFMLDAVADDDRASSILRFIVERLGPEDDTGRTPLHALVLESDAYASGVCRALRHGVLTASEHILSALIGGRRGSRTAGRLDAGFDQALTIVYRMLFLLFAEGRALVPVWHDVYRQSYTIAAMQRTLDQTGSIGLWDALRATSRLAHAGCHAGDLRVTPFNGRLFAPARTPLAERRDLDDSKAGAAITALTSRASTRGREPIDYRDLGVEQLGSVYETLLDYRPKEVDGCVTLASGSGVRKKTGTFYTPQPIADHLVRATLEPLVRGRGPEDILRLRIVDPAMGSGAFLVSACRYLAQAYETALVDAGRCHPSDIDERERASIRRTVAERSLYGVDLNPMAVQLARLSMWLTTLSADRPLSFLDHRLQTGDSIVGAWLSMLGRTPKAVTRRSKHPTASLFEDDDVRNALRFAVPIRFSLESTTSTIDDVRAKERAYGSIADKHSSVTMWKRIADVWCAAWLSPDRQVPAEAFASVADALRGRRSALPQKMVDSILAETALIARRHRLFHWELEFPEVFFGADGSPLADGGFDAVLGNPPWEMLRADSLAHDGSDVRGSIARVVRFTREAGGYRAQSDGHANCYQLFLERALALCRSGGRIGLALPSGLATDRGSAPLRRLLLSTCSVDRLSGLDNRRGMFPIHRSVRFLLLTARKGRATSEISCRFGLDDASRLDPATDVERSAPQALRVTPALLERLSGSDLTIPWLESPRDLSIAERAADRFPRLGDDGGWNARFGRELNATEDRDAFRASHTGLPVLDGRHLEPFHADISASGRRISVSDATARLAGRPFLRPRLAYRDVASATNRLTLIAALLPPRTVSTHTVFCLRTVLPAGRQHLLCGLLNSFIVNFLVRLRVTTHVGTHVVEKLPVPAVAHIGRARSASIAAMSRSLHRRFDSSVYCRLQALVASVYELTVDDFAHVLGTFPLVEREIREEALQILTKSTRI